MLNVIELYKNYNWKADEIIVIELMRLIKASLQLSFIIYLSV